MRLFLFFCFVSLWIHGHGGESDWAGFIDPNGKLPETLSHLFYPCIYAREEKQKMKTEAFRFLKFKLKNYSSF